MKRVIQAILATATLVFAFQASADTNTTTPTTTDNMTPAQKAQIEEVIHQYLLKKPEVLIEAMQILQRRQYEEAEKTVNQTKQTAGKFAGSLFQQNNDPVAGNPKGKITIVEFFDYQCPHCVDMAPVISDIIKSNPEVRVVFKEFPIRGPLSELAARSALAANKQGKYFEFSHALLAAKQPITQELIDKVAKDVGLNVEQMKKDANSSEISNQLKANITLAQGLKLFGTPAFFIGKSDASTSDTINYIPGKMSPTQLQDAINKVKS